MLTTLFSNRHQHRVVMHVFLSGLLWLTAYAQPGEQKIFSAVPAPLRMRLAERLKLLVENQRTRQWEKQYDLLSPLVTQGETKEGYVKRLRHLEAEGIETRLVNFVPTAITYKGGGPADVVIFGCAEVQKKEKLVELYASVEAYREKEDWYFSPVGIIVPVDGKPGPCPHSRRQIGQARDLAILSERSLNSAHK